MSMRINLREPVGVWLVQDNTAQWIFEGQAVA
jgi:hypothetical protein